MPPSHKWQPQVPAGILANTANTRTEGDSRGDFALPTCRVAPGAPDWASRDTTHHARFSLVSGHSQGPLSPQSSVIGDMTQHFEVVILCKSNSGHLSGELCTLIPPPPPEGEPSPVIDTVGSYRKQSQKWPASTQFEATELWTSQAHPDRVFTLQPQTINYPAECSLRLVSGLPASGASPVSMCSVSLVLIPAWKTPKAPDLGSSFLAVEDQCSDPAPTSVDILRGPRATEIVTDWRPTTLIGATGSVPGAIRYVYTAMSRDPNGLSVADKSSNLVASALEEARLNAAQSLAVAGTPMDTFVRMSSPQTDYSSSKIPIINLSISDFDEVTNTVKSDWYDVVISPQCKFVARSE